jgi:hypothetical protein
MMNLSSQPKVGDARGKAVMKGISRLVIANRVRERRTFVRCVQIENSSRTKHDGIRDPVKTYLYR